MFRGRVRHVHFVGVGGVGMSGLAEILRPVQESLRITGTVAEWEEWTETLFPESGSYVFPRGLALLEVDREADLGAYWEPNVWVRHRVG